MILKILEPAEIMRHLRIDDESEQEYLTSLGAAAEEIVEVYLGVPFDRYDVIYGAIPQAVKHACYMIVADLYRNREASSQVALNGNPAVMALLRPFKKLKTER